MAARVDLGHETSNDLVRTMRRTGQRPELRAASADGCASFDRVEAASRIAETGPDHLFIHLDVNGLRREAANWARFTAEQESRTFLDRYLMIQPTLDESWWNVWGGFDGVTGAIVDSVLAEAADQLPIDSESPQSHDSAFVVPPPSPSSA